MKIYSNVLTMADVHAAAKFARDNGQDFHLDEVSQGTSRKRARSFTVYAESLNGKRARNGREGKAASWDAYGWFMVYLFNVDADAIVGMYPTLQDFRSWCTSEVERIRTYRPADLARGHSGDFLAALMPSTQRA